MGNCCRRLCPQDEPESHQPLLPPVNEPVHPVYDSFSVPNTQPISQPLNRDDALREIIKVVESRVVDTCATEVNPIDSQEYAVRSKYYIDNVQNRPVGSPIYPINFTRPTTNPALALATTSTNRDELVSLRGVATTHGKIVRDMNNEKNEPVLITFG